MASTRPTTVDEYIQAAPAAGQPHLRRIRAILKKAAPKADEVIKWGNPFCFLFAYSAHKAHLSFAPGEAALVLFAKELAGHDTTKNFLKVAYNKPLPEDLIRKIAEYRVRVVSERGDDSFW